MEIIYFERVDLLLRLELQFNFILLFLLNITLFFSSFVVEILRYFAWTIKHMKNSIKRINNISWKWVWGGTVVKEITMRILRENQRKVHV